MNRLLAIAAAIIFIAGVVFFTIAELNKNNEEEPETYKWMKIFSVIVIVIALALAIACKSIW